MKKETSECLGKLKIYGLLLKMIPFKLSQFCSAIVVLLISSTVRVTSLANADIWGTCRGLTVVGTQGPCRDAIGPHPYGMVSTGSIHHSCLPRLFQQLCQSPGGRKENRDLFPGV